MLNPAATAASAQVALDHLPPGGWARPYLTDAGHQVAAQPAVHVTGGKFTVSVPARSVVTVVLPGQV